MLNFLRGVYIFTAVKKKLFSEEKLLYFSYFCSKHGCGSIEYPQSMFKSKSKKIMYTPVKPNFTI